MAIAPTHRSRLLFTASGRLDGGQFSGADPLVPLFSTPDGILYSAMTGVENIDSFTPEQLAIPAITDTQMRDGFTVEDFPDVAKGALFSASVLLYNTPGNEFKAVDGVGVAFDGRGAPTAGEAPASASFPMLYNGGLTTAGYDRMRTVSEDFQSTAAITTVPPGALPIADVGNWALFDYPNANIAAGVTRAAPGVGLRHVCTSILVTRERSGASSNPILVNLRDSTTGAGNILYQFPFNKTVNSNETNRFDIFHIPNLSIVGADNGAMTLEISAAPGTDTAMGVALTGYTIG